MDTVETEVLAAALRVIDRCAELGIDYHLGGSYASSVHGVPRQTHDVDLVAALDRRSAGELVARLRDRFYVDDEAVDEAVVRRASFNLVHLETGVKIDVFVKGSEPFDDQEFARRQRLRLGGRELWVKSAEDTLLRKLQWFRLGGEVSDRQWGDLEGIVRLQGERLDCEYLEEWAGRLEVADLLERLLREPGREE